MKKGKGFFPSPLKRSTEQCIPQENIRPSQLSSQSPYIEYKYDHEELPVLILPNNNLLVYTETPSFKSIYPFLCSFSQPLDRPRTIHQYRISKFSLETAMILEYTAHDIINILEKLMKNLRFPLSLEKMIRDYMQMAGRVRMRLKQNFYELITDDQIGTLLGDQLIEKIGQIQVISKGTTNFEFIIAEDEEDFMNGLEDDGQNTSKNKIVTMNRYKIKGNYFKTTQKLILNNIPLIQQYDFQNDKEKVKLNIEMVANVTLRYYQERAIKHVVINNKARSGLIILPCGAGKSLVAILLIQRIKVNTVIICESEISVEQWKEELLKWTTFPANRIVRLTGKHRDKFSRHDPNVIFITTYSMVGRKSEVKNPIILQTQKVKWGLCVADEVHKLPANTFQNVLKDYLFNIKIGLTATPYRQDNKINDLYYMIGPKLFEQNWVNLVEEGCLAKAYCIEVRCKMTPKFANEYEHLKRAELLHTANPMKFKVLQYLIKVHESRGDKIIVFCDRPKVIEYYAGQLKHAVIHGQVSSEERSRIYHMFKTTKILNVIFVSRVGDTAIDLPCANVGIQLGMHYKSRRQQVQRMGRVMRAKDNPYNDYNAFFYTLVSLDTLQVQYSSIRQKTLISQGFQYQIILQQELEYNRQPQKHKYMKQIDELDFLTQLLKDHNEGNIALEFQQNRKVNVTKKNWKTDVNVYYHQQ